MANNPTIAVRLEGGIGDHILGLRLLPFVRQKHPQAHITLYSDAAGSPVQLSIAQLCGEANEVLSLHRPTETLRMETMGSLETLPPAARQKLAAADYFYDAWGGGFYLDAARALKVPFYTILAQRPTLHIPPSATQAANQHLGPYNDAIFIGLNLSKYGAEWLNHYAEKLYTFIGRLLEHPKVIVLNFFTQQFDFSHWPTPQRLQRQHLAISEVQRIAQFSQRHERLVPIVDLPIHTVAAMLQRCQYFIGVDNGIKHLAWALRVPLTSFMQELPDLSFALRWSPDYHRVLSINCSTEELETRIDEALAEMKLPKAAE